MTDVQQGPNSCRHAVDLTQTSEDLEHPSTAAAADAVKDKDQHQQQSADSHAAAQNDGSQAEDEAQASRGRQQSGSAVTDNDQLSSDNMQQATLPSAATAGSSESDDMPQASRKRRRPNDSMTGAQHLPDKLQEDDKPVDVATQLAEEGLDPLPEEATGHRPSRQASTGKASRQDMRARIQQNQQKLWQVCDPQRCTLSCCC